LLFVSFMLPSSHYKIVLVEITDSCNKKKHPYDNQTNAYFYEGFSARS
jgi:hypothetical protein